MKFAKLGDVCEVIAGQSPPSSTYNKEGNGLPFFQGKADFGQLYPKVRIWCSKPRKVAEEGDILISVRAPVGPTNLCNVKACIGRGLSAIRVSDQIDRDFLLFYLRATESRIADLGKGSTFKAITQKDLRELSIPLPSIVEQKRLVQFFDQANSLRHNRKKSIELLDEYLKSLFLDMFGDPSKNPKQWKETTLGESCYSIKDGPHVSPKYVEKGIPFISVNNIIKGYWDFSKVRYISELDHQIYSKKSKPEKGDVLYTKGGTTGFAKYIDLDIEFSNWVHLAVLKFDKTILNGIFLEKMLNTEYCYTQSQSYTRGIANRDLVLSQMKMIKLYIPPISMQEEFANKVVKTEQIKKKMIKQSEQLELQFQALMQRSFA